MFWKKKPAKSISIVTELGEFIWDGHFAWECDSNRNDESVQLMYVGARFEVGRLPRFEHALSNLRSIVSTALEASREKIAAYHHSKDQMSLISVTIDPEESDEDYQLDFGFANWPDGGLTVHFRDAAVIASHVDD